MLYRLYARSLLISVPLVVLLGLIASDERLSSVGVVLLPGALIAAVAFPEGIHSSGGTWFIVLAAAVDAVLLAIPFTWILKQWDHYRNAARVETGANLR
jgi:hypothetical protein